MWQLGYYWRQYHTGDLPSTVGVMASRTLVGIHPSILGLGNYPSLLQDLSLQISLVSRYCTLALVIPWSLEAVGLGAGCYSVMIPRHLIPLNTNTTQIPPKLVHTKLVCNARQLINKIFSSLGFTTLSSAWTSLPATTHRLSKDYPMDHPYTTHRLPIDYPKSQRQNIPDKCNNGAENVAICWFPNLAENVSTCTKKLWILNEKCHHSSVDF